MTVGKSTYGRDDLTPEWFETDKVRDLAERLPRPLRFLMVGGLGLTTDTGLFTLALTLGAHPLVARILSLGAATLLTWRLNRNLTFDRIGRNQGAEAMRYIAVTATAQAISYAIFAFLALTALASLPQLAIVIGAAVATLISYSGHRLFSFAPGTPCARVLHSQPGRQEFRS